jgi:hypothetical protein
MIPPEVFYIVGGALIGFGLGDVYRYFRPPLSWVRRDQVRPVSDAWDDLTHVRLIK